MRQSSSFFFKRWTTFTLGALTIAACGGDAFEHGSPTVDGGADTANPRDGNGGSATGGAGGSGGTGGTGGAGGLAGGDAATDRSGDDARSDVTIMGDVRDDGIRTDSNDGRPDMATDGTTNDGSGHATDAAVDTPTWTDAPTNVDAPTIGDARDAGNDSSIGPDPSDATVSDIVCTEPVVYYKDEDGDGFGVDTDTTTSCTPLSGKWSASGGDCRDDLAAVRPFRQGDPNPPAYSGTGYPANNKPQGISFDYDCSGSEEADPTNVYGVEPDCAGPLSCSGVGYVAVNPSRQGAGIDPRCGSLTLKRCQLLFTANGAALCSSMTELTQIPYRCR